MFIQSTCCISHEFNKRTADFYHLWPLPWEMRAQPSLHFFHVKDMTLAVTPHCPLLPLSRAQHSGMWLMSPPSAVWSAASFWRPWKSFSKTFFPDPSPQLLSIWLATWYHPACCTYKMINFLCGYSTCSTGEGGTHLQTRKRQWRRKNNVTKLNAWHLFGAASHDHQQLGAVHSACLWCSLFNSFLPPSPFAC